MKYIKLFKTTAEYEAYIADVENFIVPNVSLCKDTNFTYHHKHLPEIDYSKEYFTIEALEDGLTVQLSQNASEYRIDNGNWTTLSSGTTTPAINVGQKISFKITNPTISSSYGIGMFTVNKAFNIEGNIMSLLYGDNFEGQTDLTGKDYTFYRLFWKCTTLQNAENLILPATTLTNHCYNSMFNGCTSLTIAPELPATTLANYCYQYMLSGCASLTTAPELPATTLANSCYNNMFWGCTSLTTAPVLPATTLEGYCYYYMFGSTSLTAAPKLPATTLASNCYYHMFDSCTSLTEAPELPATTLASQCYSGMFYGCTSLTTTPALPATTLAYGCYPSMFYGCTSLTEAPELPATKLADSCYPSMFFGCTGLTTAPSVLPATTLAYHCYSNMFNGCTSLTIAPELPATTLEGYCYESMFDGCTSLTTAPELPATKLADSCYRSMFFGCSKLNKITMLATDISASYCLSYWVNGVANSGTFVKSASMTSLPSGKDGIPNGWTVENEGTSTSNTIVETDETSISILSNVEISEDSISINGENIKIENDENNNYNIIIE